MKMKNLLDIKFYLFKPTKAFLFLAITIFAFVVFSSNLNAVDKGTCLKDDGSYISWAECLNSDSNNIQTQINLKNNILFTGFDSFYNDFWRIKYDVACTRFQCNSATGSYEAGNEAFNFTVRRIFADIAFIVVSAIIVILILKVFYDIFIVGFDEEKGMENFMKSSKYKISVLLGLGIFVIVASVFTKLADLGYFWQVGFRL
ncbi:hypothetical protein IPJ91_03470 [bacterium]|nr:MAG: hypothetical protein IPJ91_03470 [bacterium]